MLTLGRGLAVKSGAVSQLLPQRVANRIATNSTQATLTHAIHRGAFAVGGRKAVRRSAATWDRRSYRDASNPFGSSSPPSAAFACALQHPASIRRAPSSGKPWSLPGSVPADRRDCGSSESAQRRRCSTTKSDLVSGEPAEYRPVAENPEVTEPPALPGSGCSGDPQVRHPVPRGLCG